MQVVVASKNVLILFGILLVLAACDGASAGGTATDTPSIATAAPTASAAATLMPAPSATAAPTALPAATLAPTAPPPSSTPAPPTATLVPLEANTIPDNGEFDDELPFNTSANDPTVGSNSGDGIASVTFQFFGSNGKEIYSRTENNTLYCAFGGGDDGQDCDRWIFSEHKNQWPNGKPAHSGAYTIVVTIHGKNGATARNQRQVTLNLNSE